MESELRGNRTALASSILRLSSTRIYQSCGSFPVLLESRCGSFALRRSLNLFPSALFRRHSRSSHLACVFFSLPLRFFPTPSGSLRSGHTVISACFSDRSPALSGGRPSRLRRITPWEETAIRPGKESQSEALCRQQPARFRPATRSLQSDLSRPAMQLSLNRVSDRRVL
jgi:hypothetical protein